MTEIYRLPLIPLRGVVAFPGVEFMFDIKRTISSAAISEAMKNDRRIALIAQKDPSQEDITEKDLYRVGVLASIIQVYKIAPGVERVVALCTKRIVLTTVLTHVPFFTVICTEPSPGENDFSGDDEKKAVEDLLKEEFEKYCLNSNGMNPEFIDELLKINNLGLAINVMGARLNLRISDKQRLLETMPLKARALELLKILKGENNVLGIKRKIDMQVRSNIEKLQRENILREQLKVISDELMEKDGLAGEIADYKKRMEKLKLSDEAKEKLEKEIDRLKKIPQMAAEGSVCRDYIDLVLSLPWGICSKENKNLKRAENILEKDHYGLEDVKERIIEYLALRLTTEDPNAPVLCLVGPPGVGKTSIAKSIARATGRKYVRMSLGGLHDEAELRGHRKTYVGAMPGRIINAVKNAGVSNPLILMDEIDKVGSDYKGDPSAALLEILDGEQNFSFRDNYLELPYDISKVLFICTANTVDTIPPALKDRMEIITLGSYTKEEKLKIATKYLVKKQLKIHGLTSKQLKIKAPVIEDIIEGYTKEAGVRNLERAIGKICRKALKEMLTTDVSEITVTKSKLAEYLGSRKIRKETVPTENRIGEVTGLAWTALGGTTLIIEVNVYSGSGKVRLTGNMGKVMEESAYAAYSYIRANASKLGISVKLDETDIHIHIPEGAVPKDGPSAGITMTTAMVSALTNIPVDRETAMTGEITIRGNVLPIGGLKEKLLAAKAAGVKRVIIPMDNSADLEELPEYVKENLEFVLADHVDAVLKTALVKAELPISKAEAKAEPIMPAIIREGDKPQIRS